MFRKSTWTALLAGSALVSVAFLGRSVLNSVPATSVQAQSTTCPATTPVSTVTLSASPTPAAFCIDPGGPYTGQTNQPVTFKATPRNGAAGDTFSDLNFLWTFGDGTFGTGATVMHTYTTTGTFPVSVVATGNGRSATAQTTATITQGLNVSAGGPYSGTISQGIQFTATATGTVPSDVVYTWDFGDGFTGTGMTVTHAYTTTGTFNVKLSAASATTMQTGFATTTATIAAQNPNITITIGGPTTATAGQPVTFTVSPTGNVPSDVVYTFNFGDQTANATGTSVTHTFAAPGTYTVNVSASSASNPSSGGAASLTVTVVAATPSPSPSPSPSPVPTGPTATYAPGWNIVAGPTGMTFTQAANPLYSSPVNNPAAPNYTSQPNTQPVVAGQGYWAYFYATTTVTLTGNTTLPFSVLVPAGQYVQIGNPSSTSSVTVTGADIVYAYDPTVPVGGQPYTATTTLRPGQGAWVYSNAGGTVTLR